MPEKLKVLISAYACEPNKGSEPEVGWQWALQMAQYHDVTVLTRANNRESIERELALLAGSRPVPRFVYHEEGRFLLWVKRRFKAVRLYYLLWQISAGRVVERLKLHGSFDLLHHVTFAGFRYRTAIWNHGIATVWGPVGGVESIPWRLLPWRFAPSLFSEALRNLNNFLQATPFHVLPKRAQSTTITLVSTEETAETFLRLGLETTLMPTIGLNIRPMKPRPADLNPGPLKLLFVGKIITLKGIDLAIEALKESGINARYTIVGDGDFASAARRLVAKLGLDAQVEFRGRVPRLQALEIYSEFDAFLFPSLHDTGGYAIIEAMSCGVPVICLDCGGPRVAVKTGAGVRVPLGSRAEVIRGLAEALRSYDRDRRLMRAHGAAAREVILRDYDWNKKGPQLDLVYRKAVAAHQAANQGAAKSVGLKVSAFFNRRLSIQGTVISAVILFIIGTAGFLSVGHLKKNAESIMTDTLPGLSDAGSANSSLAEAFNRTLLLLMAETPAERAAYRKELTALNGKITASPAVSSRISPSIREKEIRQEVLQYREKYNALRIEVLNLVDQGKRDQALALCKTAMVPAYLDYKSAAEKVLNFNAQQGRTRGQTILKICTITQYLVAAVAILLFAGGFLIGLFK